MQVDQAARELTTFDLPIWFSLLAHVTFGATGALVAMRRGYDVIGVFFLAIVTAIGGGLIRDGMLISSGPASILTSRVLLMAVLAGTVVAMMFYKIVDRLGRAIAVVDALGLGAFAVYGTQKSLQAGLSEPAAIMGGMITAVGGGLLRDVLVREEPLLLKPGQFYALVALAGCCLYIGLPRLELVGPEQAANITIIVVFAIRMLAIRFNWRTTALHHADLPPAPPG